jgi:hypothetical protein
VDLFEKKKHEHEKEIYKNEWKVRELRNLQYFILMLCVNEPKQQQNAM